MAAVEWNGVGKAGVLRADLERERNGVADAARAGQWNEVLAMLRRSPKLVNAVRPGDRFRFAPLHQAAYAKAPLSVVAALVGFGAWRTLRTAQGDRAIDLLDKRAAPALRELLTPWRARAVPDTVLAAVQTNFHAVIAGRVGTLIDESDLMLPQLAPMLEVTEPEWWFPVPGMYGGFSYRLERDGPNAMIVSESWCRVVGGSGERHEIDAAGSRLVDSGFA